MDYWHFFWALKGGPLFPLACGNRTHRLPTFPPPCPFSYNLLCVFLWVWGGGEFLFGPFFWGGVRGMISIQVWTKQRHWASISLYYLIYLIRLAGIVEFFCIFTINPTNNFPDIFLVLIPPLPPLFSPSQLVSVPCIPPLPVLQRCRQCLLLWGPEASGGAPPAAHKALRIYGEGAPPKSPIWSPSPPPPSGTGGLVYQ